MLDCCRCCRKEGHHDRGPGSPRWAAPGAAGVARRGRGAVRLLPTRADHAGRGAARLEAEPLRHRHRPDHERVPVRHVLPDSEGDQKRRVEDVNRQADGSLMWPCAAAAASPLVDDEGCPMGERVVQGACRGVVLLGQPVDAPSPGLVGERVHGLDEPAGNILAAPRLGDVEILQIARWVCRPRRGHARSGAQARPADRPARRRVHAPANSGRTVLPRFRR